MHKASSIVYVLASLCACPAAWLTVSRTTRPPAGTTTARALFTAPPPRITICHERIPNVTELREAVTHELTHAHDVSGGRWRHLGVGRGLPAWSDTPSVAAFAWHVCVHARLQYLVQGMDLAECEGLACR